MKLKIKPQDLIKLSPCELIENEQGLILKRGTNLIVIANKDKIIAIQFLLDYLQKERTFKSLRIHFLECYDEKLFYEFISLLSESYLIRINNKPDIYTDAELLFFEQSGISIYDFRKKLDSQKIFIIGDNSILNEFASIYSKYGNERLAAIGLSEFINMKNNILFKQRTTVIACVSSAEVNKLIQLNSMLKKLDVDLLPIVLRDAFCHIGPFVQSGSSPCFECSVDRYNSNHIMLADIYSQTRSTIYSLAEHVAKFIAALVFQQYIYSFTNKHNICSNSLIEANINIFSVQRRPLLISPGCTNCC